jgi:hypothetical protein
LPPLPGVRQLVPALPFGEESVLLDVAVPAQAAPAGDRPWVVLQQWHILRQPTPRLLVCDDGSGIAPALELASHIVRPLGGTATILGVAEDERQQDAMREALTRRAAEAGVADAVVRVRRGDAAEQIAHEQTEAPYDFVVVGAGEIESLRGLRRSESVAEELLPSMRIPLLTARGRPKKPESILICTAVGEPGKSDVRAGGWLARRLGATATLLHVLKPGEAAQPLALAHLERGVATLRELGVASRYSVRPAGGPTEGILAELSERPHDLVVIGAGPGGGGVTRRLLRECGRSILVVPEGSW